MQHSRRSGLCSSDCLQASHQAAVPHAADIMQDIMQRSTHPLRRAHPHCSGSCSSPRPRLQADVICAIPSADGFPWSAEHQDKVETVEAVIICAMEIARFFVHFCIINRAQLFDIAVKTLFTLFMSIHEK